MALMLVVLTAVSATFVSGTHSETVASNRIRAESDARQALTKMRDDLHCSFAITSVTQNSLGGFTLTMTEFYNTCKAVDQNPGSGSKVLLSWCTIPSPTQPERLRSLPREHHLRHHGHAGRRERHRRSPRPAGRRTRRRPGSAVPARRRAGPGTSGRPRRRASSATCRRSRSTWRSTPIFSNAPDQQVRAEGPDRAPQLDPLRHGHGHPRRADADVSRRRRSAPKSNGDHPVRDSSPAARTRRRRSPSSTGSSRPLRPTARPAERRSARRARPATAPTPRASATRRRPPATTSGGTRRCLPTRTTSRR